MAENVKEARDRNADTYNRTAVEPDYKVGDTVYLRNELVNRNQPPHKLLPAFTGPFAITEISPRYTVKLQHLYTGKLMKPHVHMSKIKHARLNRHLLRQKYSPSPSTDIDLPPDLFSEPTPDDRDPEPGSLTSTTPLADTSATPPLQMISDVPVDGVPRDQIQQTSRNVTDTSTQNPALPKPHQTELDSSLVQPACVSGSGSVTNSDPMPAGVTPNVASDQPPVSLARNTLSIQPLPTRQSHFSHTPDVPVNGQSTDQRPFMTNRFAPPQHLYPTVIITQPTSATTWSTTPTRDPPHVNDGASLRCDTSLPSSTTQLDPSAPTFRPIAPAVVTSPSAQLSASEPSLLQPSVTVMGIDPSSPTTSQLSASTNATQHTHPADSPPLTRSVTQTSPSRHRSSHLPTPEIIAKRMSGKRLQMLVRYPPLTTRTWTSASNLPAEVVANYMARCYANKQRKRSRQRAQFGQR